jgi:hypothetical protein
MPILESEEQRSRVKRALSEIRDATDADVQLLANFAVGG